MSSSGYNPKFPEYKTENNLPNLRYTVAGVAWMLPALVTVIAKGEPASILAAALAGTCGWIFTALSIHRNLSKPHQPK